MKKTLIFFSVLMIGLSIGMLINHKLQSTSTPNKAVEVVAYQEILDKEIVIETLKEKAEIVGLEGEFNKEYFHKENTISSGINFIQRAGERSFSISLNGTFKMGFDLNDIKADHIFIVGNTVKIITPKPTLISFEAPYHLAEIEKKKGFLVKDFTEEDRKEIYQEAFKSALNETMNDENIEKQTINATRNAIKQLLLSIKLVEKVEFIDI